MKTVSVLGATGNQGSSVVQSFSRSGEWHIRAITRNPSSAKAQALLAYSDQIELVQADLNDVGSLTAAFAGATVIFAVTDYWAPFSDSEVVRQHGDGPNAGESLRKYAYELELQHGRNIAAAAAAAAAAQSAGGPAALTHFVLSCEPSMEATSGGKYRDIYHFESKAAVERHVREAYPALAARMAVLYVGFYASNMLRLRPMWPARQADGSFVVRRLCPGDAALPFVLADEHTGPLVEALVARPVDPARPLLAYTGLISWADMADLWAAATGRHTVFQQVTVEEFGRHFPVEGSEFLSATCSAEFGFAGRINVLTPEDLGVNLGGHQAIKQWFKRQDWTDVVNAKPQDG